MEETSAKVEKKRKDKIRNQRRKTRKNLLNLKSIKKSKNESNLFIEHKLTTKMSSEEVSTYREELRWRARYLFLREEKAIQFQTFLLFLEEGRGEEGRELAMAGPPEERHQQRGRNSRGHSRQTPRPRQKYLYIE
jgi:hypothetical protein